MSMRSVDELSGSEPGASAVGIVPAVTPARGHRRAEKRLHANASSLGHTAAILAAFLASWGSMASAETAALVRSVQASSPPAASSGTPPASQSQQAVSFVIEKIVVEGVRHGSERIVVSELLLTLGNAYTEAQLREALHRVKRLPFVVEADFSLRRGSERGHFELVVTVSEAWPVFLGGSLAVVGLDDVFSNTDWSTFAAPEVGARVFFGGQSEATATVKGLVGSGVLPRDSTVLFDAVYRHHNLFGRHVVGTVFVRTPELFRRGYEIGASLGVPLSRVSTLDGTFLRSSRRVESTAFVPRYEETAHRADVAWRRDTTDDPFTPRLGSRLLSDLAYFTHESTIARAGAPWTNPGPPGSSEVWNHSSTGRGVGASLIARRYWPLSPRTSLGAGASLHGSITEYDTTATSAAERQTWSSRNSGGGAGVEAEILRTLPALGRGLTEFWWSAKATFGVSLNRFEVESRDTPLPYRINEFRVANSGLSLSLAARGRWGIARLELTWRHSFRPVNELR